jgi:hypothetical protein
MPGLRGMNWLRLLPGQQKIASNIVIASEREAIQSYNAALDCFVAESVIGRAFARPVGSSQ